MAELNALATGVGEIVIPAAMTAVLAVIILEVFFTLGLILVRGVKSVHAKAIVGAAVPSTQHLVDLIGGNKKLPVRGKPVGNGKMKRLPLQVTEPLQYLFRTVKAKTQKVLPCIQRGVERRPFVHALLQRIRCTEKLINLLLRFRIAALDGLRQHGQRQKSRVSRFRCHVPAGVGNAVSKPHPLVVIDLIEFTLRHIPPQLQQLPDTLCRFLPGDQCGMAPLCRAAAGNTHPLGVIPKRNFLSAKIEARTVLSVVFLQECGVVRLILHKVSADDQPAMLVVGSYTQGFVNDLLRQLGMGKQRRSRCTVRLVECRHIKQRKLL